MSEPTPGPETPVDWRKLHAFGLPAGSVRALLALLIGGAIWAYLLLRPDQEVPDYLRDLLFIILGHYFAVRARAERSAEPGPPPLFLPNGSVRLLLVAGFAAVGVVLYRRGELLDVGRHPAALTLLLVAGFLLGVIAQQVAAWWSGRGRRVPKFVEDARAAVALAAAVLLVALVIDQVAPFLPRRGLDPIPRLGRYGPEHILAAVVGFYFGSRS